MMHLLPFLILAGQAFNPTTAHTTPSHPEISCTNLKTPQFPALQVLSLTSKPYHNLTVPTPPTTINNLNICEVNITLTHPGAGDKVFLQLWLPLFNWNSRFVAIGGGAWAAGTGPASIAGVVGQGFAAGWTDAGLSGDPYSPAAWALKGDGKVNLELLENFASRSVHDLATIGKAITSTFYGKQVKKSYFNGCSTGGRQGLAAAQQYPNDFDGILAGAPAINWDKYVMAELWPQVIMKEANFFPSLCELNAVVQAAIRACDPVDGVEDDVITSPITCIFDPERAVGSKVTCERKDIVISRKVANIVRRIWDGPRDTSGKSLWYGLPIGAPMDFLANSIVSPKDITVGSPFFIADTWIRYFVKADPNYNISNINIKELSKLFAESTKKYEKIIGTSDPNLSSFENSGGRLIVWHGGADQLIFPQGSTQYRQRVEQLMGGRARIDEFFRYFIAPGVGHCGIEGTAGAVPTDPFGALISWVENEMAPDVLAAETLPSSPHFTRNLCRYPFVSRYRGFGDVNAAESFFCGRE